MPTHRGRGARTRTYSNSTERLVTSSLAVLALSLAYIAATSHSVAFGAGTKAVGWGENLGDTWLCANHVLMAAPPVAAN